MIALLVVVVLFVVLSLATGGDMRDDKRDRDTLRSLYDRNR